MTVSHEILEERHNNLSEKVEGLVAQVKDHEAQLADIALWRAKILGIITVVSPAIALAVHFVIKVLEKHL